jgi:Holliday junction resolvase RusA-like endonuclease
MGKQRPRHGKGFTYTPKETVNYETLVKQLYVQQCCSKMLDGQLEVKVKAYFSIPKSASKKAFANMQEGKERPAKKPDWDNIGKIITDALNKLAYNDDSQIVTAMVEKWYSTNPRVEVEISEVVA